MSRKKKNTKVASKPVVTIWQIGDRVLHRLKPTPIGTITELTPFGYLYVEWYKGSPIYESEPQLVRAVPLIREISFDEILSVWANKLWPGRESPIRPVSTMTYERGYDMTLKQATPYFWGAFVNGRLVGVNSGFKTGEDSFRSRGIWVDPFYTGFGLAQKLMQATEDKARELGCRTLWSIPRRSAIGFYERCGFTRSSEWFDEGMEFGPNAYAIKSLTVSDE